jgi:hypothetical protein
VKNSGYFLFCEFCRYLAKSTTQHKFVLITYIAKSTKNQKAKPVKRFFRSAKFHTGLGYIWQRMWLIISRGSGWLLIATNKGRNYPTEQAQKGYSDGYFSTNRESVGKG